MSAPVRTILPATTVAAAQRVLLRYGHSGLCVVDDRGKLQGIISRRDLDLASHYGLGHSPVKGHMTALNLKTVTPQTTVGKLWSLMATYDIGRLPVIDNDELVGIVTRTDVLRQSAPLSDKGFPSSAIVYKRLQTSLQAYPLDSEDVWTLLTQIADAAQQRGWHLYVVGGAVRDLLVAASETSLLDIDLVVDGFQSPVVEGAGVVLAQQLQEQYPETELQVYGEFQTAALSWQTNHHTSLVIDIATARTEFYPYPAANPDVEPSSIHQDLYRRDFTMNAMALRLTDPQSGLLLDFLGGCLDIQKRQVRVLHANSFIEDPTRIFRAVRFAMRLGFSIEPQTETFIRYAVSSGIYEKLQQTKRRLPALQTRLKAELTYLFQVDYWPQTLRLLDKLGALSCLQPNLTLTAELWRHLHRVERWRQLFVERAGKDINVAPWLVRLEVLLAGVEVRSQIANNLQLPLSSIQRLTQLALVEATLLDQFNRPEPPNPSFIYQTLVPYDLPMLLLVSVRHAKQIGQYVWYYITELIHIKAPIDGHYLKKLGYSPGPLYRQILTALTNEVLDGNIASLASVEAYLKRSYPIEDHR